MLCKYNNEINLKKKEKKNIQNYATTYADFFVFIFCSIFSFE